MYGEVEDEATVTDSYSVALPAAIRRAADIEAGDKICWRVDDDGTLSVEHIKQRYEAFDDIEPVDIGETTDVADDHDRLAGDATRRR